ncbi:hypothetical protein ACHQM5_017319 [Ranunculus cassubicifolius]
MFKTITSILLIFFVLSYNDEICLQDVFVSQNEDYNTMLQPFLSARYVAATENVWTASAPMPTSFPQPASTMNPLKIPASDHVPIWTANPWTIPPSVPVPMGFAPETTISSTMTIPTSSALPPNSVLQGMEHLSVSAPRTVQDIRSELFVGVGDFSCQSVSPWIKRVQASAPTNSVFQTTNVTPCNGQASDPLAASSMSQQMGQLGVNPQPLPVDGD